ncbi:MAG: response regulator transcription factor [Clostridia bacterium]|nr:response regulator transcription factor [Clostridia bacterium]
MIYCVEDDINIRELIEYTLVQSGFEFCGFENSTDFYDKLSQKKPDLILLDIMLPDKDGMTILKELRASRITKSLPIIMLTAKSGQMDKIKGLDSGADDYITKPFDILELISRIKALLRRTEKKESVLEYKNIFIDSEKRVITVDSVPVTLTYKEFELLCLLIRNNGIVMDRERIMNEIWGVDFEGETRTVDVHIRTLRQKLGEAGNCIETIRNVGYRIG